MKCKEAADLLIEYIYDELGPEERQAVEEHLAVCPACAEDFQSMSGVRGLAAGMADPDPSVMAVNRILATARDESQKAAPLFGSIRSKLLAAVGLAAVALVLAIVAVPQFASYRSSPLPPPPSGMDDRTALVETQPAVAERLEPVPGEETAPSTPTVATEEVVSEETVTATRRVTRGAATFDELEELPEPSPAPAAESGPSSPTATARLRSAPAPSTEPDTAMGGRSGSEPAQIVAKAKPASPPAEKKTESQPTPAPEPPKPVAQLQADEKPTRTASTGGPAHQNAPTESRTLTVADGLREGREAFNAGDYKRSVGPIGFTCSCW